MFYQSFVSHKKRFWTILKALFHVKSVLSHLDQEKQFYICSFLTSLRNYFIDFAKCMLKRSGDFYHIYKIPISNFRFSYFNI